MKETSGQQVKVLVIGDVAAGTKEGTKQKTEVWRVLLITRIKDISYAGCGLPIM